MKKYFMLPTWIFLGIARRWFRDGHPWKDRKWFTLEEYHLRATDTLVEYNFGILTSLTVLCFYLLILLRNLL
jgi:hypothetical protein